MIKEVRGWPKYVFGGRVRTSTLALILAFALTFGLYQAYKPAPPEQAPASNVVPPGFVPDPNYTWVPRTNVQEPRRTTPKTTTPTTTSPTETTSPETTTSGPPTSSPPTTSPATSPTTSAPAPPGPAPSAVPGPGPLTPPSR